MSTARRPSLTRRLARTVQRTIPFVVWGLAIVAALAVYQHKESARADFSAFAEAQPVRLAYLESGLIDAVHVRLYQSVEENQALVVLDEGEQTRALERLDREIEHLRAQVRAEETRLELDARSESIDTLDLARRYMIDREEAQLEFLREMTELSRDRMRLEGAIVNYEAVAQLGRDEVVSTITLNDAQTEMDSLRAQTDRQQSRMERAKAIYEDRARRYLEFTEGREVEVPAEALFTPIRLAIEMKRSEIQEVERRIKALVLRSPIKGQVTALHAAKGERHLAGSPLVVIHPEATHRVVAWVPDARIHEVREGLEVEVDRLAKNKPVQKHRGRVVELSSIVSDAPLHYRTLPDLPLRGRSMIVELEAMEKPLIPGEKVALRVLKDSVVR